MRVRFLKGRATGQVADVPAPLARQYLNLGLAEEDKSLDGPSELKAPAVEEPLPGPRSSPRTLRARLGRSR